VPCSNAANIGERKTWMQSEFCTSQNSVKGQEPQKMYIHRVSKNVPSLICYNFSIHGLITIVFGRSVTQKVDNQNVLYFPTSRNLCLCITWGNRKPENCVFSLKCCMFFFYQKHIKISPIVTLLQLNHPSLSKRSTRCTRQDLGSCCLLRQC